MVIIKRPHTYVYIVCYLIRFFYSIVIIFFSFFTSFDDASYYVYRLGSRACRVVFYLMLLFFANHLSLTLSCSFVLSFIHSFLFLWSQFLRSFVLFCSWNTPASLWWHYYFTILFHSLLHVFQKPFSICRNTAHYVSHSYI